MKRVIDSAETAASPRKAGPRCKPESRTIRPYLVSPLNASSALADGAFVF